MKKLYVSAAAIVLATAVCVSLGFSYEVPDDEKQQGLTGVYDVADSGAVGYVTYEDGKPTIYVKADKETQAAQLPADQSISDIVMLPGGKKLFYVSTDKTMTDGSGSIVHEVDIMEGTDVVLFEEDAIITELAMDEGEPNRLFYLQAGVYTNYSPVAAEYPHEFDIFTYDIAKKKHHRLTELQKYSMASLQVSGIEQAVYVQMDNDLESTTPEELYEANQRIFQIPLDRPDQPKIIFMPMETGDLYDFALIPDHTTLIYQAVAGTNDRGIYEYELFGYNWGTMQTERLTFQKEHAARPVYGADQKLYYMVDYNFAGRQPDYTLFRMELNGSETEQVPLRGAAD
ncbi:hypothetical protein NCCP2716_21770 [Sporosarcina sp. NCCP-2716]|uniref:hypothetical protein n=1 Tax=Sporosarcina sp. NCCP-2716 TaxID=2943679 RepID=UPI002041149E|nr:hypothetical protein [Sporosarcina sp. NCCP-2716]GKV69679.1 hypothetical protein NCCP2716_21770 [Sporosarcina sp. NCCP-2716]